MSTPENDDSLIVRVEASGSAATGEVAPSQPISSANDIEVTTVGGNEGDNSNNNHNVYEGDIVNDVNDTDNNNNNSSNDRSRSAIGASSLLEETDGQSPNDDANGSNAVQSEAPRDEGHGNNDSSNIMNNNNNSPTEADSGMPGRISGTESSPFVVSEGVGEGDVRGRASTEEMIDDSTETGNPMVLKESSWEKAFETKVRDTFYLKYIDPWVNKGSVSNFITFTVFMIGLIIILTDSDDDDDDEKSTQRLAGDYILAFGLFGFAGGITNWLAVKMLFDKVPGLYGSGVIPARFKEIRSKMKSVIMTVFFDVEFLERYLTTKASQFLSGIDIEGKINAMLASPEVDELIDVKLADLAERPEGMFLAMMAIDVKQLKPMIKPFVLGMGTDMAPILMRELSPGKLLDIRKLRDEVDSLMDAKLLELTPAIVKKMMEEVIRDHLGWLVVWGNVFGGLIGIISLAAGYGK